MSVWAIANQKGGVGKTTTAVTLAGLLADDGRDVVVVDLDPHGSMSGYFGFDPEAESGGAYTLFQSTADARNPDALALVKATGTERLHLVPATTALATLDRQLGDREGMGLVISRAVKQLAQRFGHIIIDCPPVLGVLMVNALAACDFLIVPVQTEYLALKGLDRMLRTLEMVRRARSASLPYLIVPCFFDRRTRASINALRVLRERYAEHLWRGVIPIDTQFREASQAGVPLSALCTHTRGLDAYRELLGELVETRPPAQRAVAL